MQQLALVRALDARIKYVRGIGIHRMQQLSLARALNARTCAVSSACVQRALPPAGSTQTQPSRAPCTATGVRKKHGMTYTDYPYITARL
jgi:hypothetical protein